MAGILKDKVVLVTGAGGGIGREMAILCAKEGAKVVVNDLGGAVDGEGEGSQTPAAKVCEEIKAAGGIGIPNYGSVSDPAAAEAMIKQAVENFGRIDGVINNAGILRDRIFHRMSHLDWKQVIDVHLNGAFNTSRAAANYFKEQKSGAFVHFTSTSGLVGNFGQANYSAAKMGIIGLSRSIALDMKAFNVRSNCISPFAWTRMIGTIPADTPQQKARVERSKRMTPAKIAPMAAFLLSDAAEGVTSQIFGVRMNEIMLFNANRPVRSVHMSEGWTPQSIAETAIPAMKPHFISLDRSPEYFTWDPI
ncbi:SDR family NAD(P)-dependent oxidoreductase [Reyranella sp. CPCC 100927]|uniref:SDR family NAD(P)-dependent oxidoreductase n=1 Tax=Reyranella sp. CPCC 100927 TaxID=2599616 RepID=UPI0011B63F23|nr:SDR family NAD(P)-dependent oxidoreductase [Reyranella sp. CPCC 100927]TWT10060.1 SDR family oxidoreductase [Reyranella sp. CPCC 100927]